MRPRKTDSLEKVVEKEYLPIRIICGRNEDETPCDYHVDRELRHWNETVIMAWLQSHLISPVGYTANDTREYAKELFPARIVFEAMMNCIRHPGANKIASTSHILWPEETPGKGTFTTIWWDNGKGIVETLRQTLEDNGSIVSDAIPLPEKNCWISFKNYSYENDNTETIMVKKLTTSFVPDKMTPDDELLFASSCARITRDPEGKGHRSALGNDVPNDSPLRQPGMGLYILIDCAVNIFGGSVSFRTSKYFMNIKRGLKRGDNKADYAVSILSYDSHFSFPGNMLTVRLPVQRQAESII